MGFLRLLSGCQASDSLEAGVLSRRRKTGQSRFGSFEIGIRCRIGMNRVCMRHGNGTSPVLLVLLALSFCDTNVNAQPVHGSITTRPVLYTFGPSVIDMAGNVYSTGNAGLNQVVITSGAAQTQPGGGTCVTPGGGIGPGIIDRPCIDAYITKQDAAGNTVFATYLGGPTDDVAVALAVDSAGSAYVVG